MEEKKRLNKLLGKMLTVRQLAPSLKHMTEQDLKRRRELYHNSKRISQERYEELIAEGFEPGNKEIYEKNKANLQKRYKQLKAKGLKDGDKELEDVKKELEELEKKGFKEGDRELEEPKKEINKLNILLKELDIIEDVLAEMPLYELDRKIGIYETRKNLLQEKYEELIAEGFEKGDKEIDEINKEMKEIEELIDVCEKLKKVLPENFKSEKTISRTQENQQGKGQQGKGQQGDGQQGEGQQGEGQQGDGQQGKGKQGDGQQGDGQQGDGQQGKGKQGDGQQGDGQQGKGQQGAPEPECKIRIGRDGTVEYDGKEYKVSKEHVKYGVKINSVNDESLKEYLITYIGIKSEHVKTIQELVREGLLDMTVVHAIFATSMEKDKKQQLFRRHVNKIQNLKAGKDYDGIDITYDMEDLSKVKFWDRFRRKEVNLDEKTEIYKKAVIAKKCKIGQIEGKYEPLGKIRKLFNRIRKSNKQLPTPETIEQEFLAEPHMIAKEYNKIAYDKDGNKVTQENALNGFRERVRTSRNLDENDENRLSEDQEIGVYQLIKNHTDSVEQKSEESHEENSDHSDHETAR